jgi:phosphate transport system protein
VSSILLKEIENLKAGLLSLGALVEETVHQAVKALVERDAAIADKVISNDDRIDQAEVDLEEEGLKIIALHQPVAIDLRFIVAVLRINSELERIGDLAVNIAERAVFIANQRPLTFPFDFEGMAGKTKIMLKKSLDALVGMNTDLAREVIDADDEVDAMNREMYIQIQDEIRRNPDQIACLIHFLSSSRHLERMADHTTNIAEDVIYMTEGEIVRHKPEDYRTERGCSPDSGE